MKHIRSTNLQQGEPQPLDAHRIPALNTVLEGNDVSTQSKKLFKKKKVISGLYTVAPFSSVKSSSNAIPFS